MTISDLNAETRSLTDTTTTTYTAADLLRRINAAYEQVISWILNADGTWQFDDDNYSTIPEGTTTLVASQSDYSFSNTFLEIEWVKVKDSAGNWQLLTPLDQSQTDTPLEDYLITDGFPQYYDKVGNVIRLYPAPAAAQVTLSAGLKVGINRTASLYTSAEVTTGTKTPGFASPFHVILAYMAAIPYCQSYKKDRVPLFEKKVQELKNDLIAFYGHRERDKRKVMSSAPISFR